MIGWYDYRTLLSVQLHFLTNYRQPSSKFTFPLNNDEIRNGTAFTISLATANLETGNFANAQQNYLSAPQQLNSQGLIKGYALVIIEQVDSFSQITPTDPTRFAFVKGMNTPAVNGVLTANVQGGLEVGTYRMSSKIATTNHMPVVLPINQHGAVDDFVYVGVHILIRQGLSHLLLSVHCVHQWNNPGRYDSRFCWSGCWFTESFPGEYYCVLIFPNFHIHSILTSH